MLEQQVSQRLQARLTRLIGTRLAVRFVGQIDILKFHAILALIDTPAQFGRELPLLLNSGEYGLLAAFEFLEFGVLRLNGSNLQFIERASALLAVARDKRDSGTLVQQTDNGLHLLLAQTKATTDNG